MAYCRFIRSIYDVSPEEWDALWCTGYPFVQHRFFAALEASASTHKKTGWEPCHCLVLEQENLLAVMPLFIKSHSYGEYVFDWAWAEAYARAGLDYYPKLLSAIPFTPATGPRIGFRPSLNASERTRLLKDIFNGIKQQLELIQGSSFHSLFPQCEDVELLNSLPLAKREGCQFHWFNQGYCDFDDFLSGFSSRKRKVVKRERKKVKEQGIELLVREAHQVPRKDWQTFYLLYQRTYLKRSGGRGYLGADFFYRLAESFPDQVILVSAYKSQELVAAALYLRDDNTLYGRYWGAVEDIDGLHFEACYYQGIEYAITEGISRFDPGAQGEHKIQRGFTAIKTRSYHYLAHPEFHRAVEESTKEEAAHVDQYIADARAYLPFKEGAVLVSPSCLVEG